MENIFSKDFEKEMLGVLSEIRDSLKEIAKVNKSDHHVVIKEVNIEDIVETISDKMGKRLGNLGV